MYSNMKIKVLLYLALIALTSMLKAQSSVNFEDSFIESTTDHDKLLMYVDSISKYIYRNTQVAEEGQGSTFQVKFPIINHEQQQETIHDLSMEHS